MDGCIIIGFLCMIQLFVEINFFHQQLKANKSHRNDFRSNQFTETSHIQPTTAMDRRHRTPCPIPF